MTPIDGGIVMKTKHKIRLTSAEIGHLWQSYMLETLVYHVFLVFLNHVDDSQIKSYVEYCQRSSQRHIQQVKAVFQAENFPIPRGMTSEDIRLKAPRVFSDVLYVNYIKNMAKYALIMYATAYTECSRDDIRKLFRGFLSTLEVIDQKGTEILLSKGLHTRRPFIPTPTGVDFVDKQNFLNGFLGNKRPLSVMEMSQLFMNAQSNALGKAVLTGFSQVTSSKELRQYFERGKDLSNKYFQAFTDLLVKEDISAPPSFDGEITDSTESPFSDRLMLFHVSLLVSSGMSNYGVALSASQRRDLALMYGRVIAEVGTYAEAGAKLLIKNGWMEQPPLAPDREALAKVKI